MYKYAHERNTTDLTQDDIFAIQSRSQENISKATTKTTTSTITTKPTTTKKLEKI